MLNYPLEIPSKVYDLLLQLLTTGTVSVEGKSVDFSKLQKITIADGVLEFEPAVKVSLKLGPIAIKTTLSSIKATDGGLKIEIDNSPVDILLKPED